ncbi:hypothetical protein PUNSTDRAFT_139704 [Punctularia strigosozonata HHB-11173 SS5]|uniref:Uncharacterized protein n=1 Tax=Punctularia strigosozonata (strain HHB-11173) TaxID=741275 RepID=R7RZ72_PUNST|nr:uncharacterized protein PUNSTDRAFT_139704 [Punctularia strigosozonata HHB-11173 SS5]EIN03273.1 hypothetical protein PUNSTDRAFT_139704 [Punctularia strigosozonata HHB-11173 SS5]
MTTTGKLTVVVCIGDHQDPVALNARGPLTVSLIEYPDSTSNMASDIPPAMDIIQYGWNNDLGDNSVLLVQMEIPGPSTSTVKFFLQYQAVEEVSEFRAQITRPYHFIYVDNSDDLNSLKTRNQHQPPEDNVTKDDLEKIVTVLLDSNQNTPWRAFLTNCLGMPKRARPKGFKNAMSHHAALLAAWLLINPTNTFQGLLHATERSFQAVVNNGDWAVYKQRAWLFTAYQVAGGISDGGMLASSTSSNLATTFQQTTEKFEKIQDKTLGDLPPAFQANIRSYITRPLLSTLFN